MQILVDPCHKNENDVIDIFPTKNVGIYDILKIQDSTESMFMFRIAILLDFSNTKQSHDPLAF